MTTILVPVNSHALPQRPPAELVELARRVLAESNSMEWPAGRYAAAHLAALRAAAAVIGTRARPAPAGRRRITSVWVLLTIVAPELGEWAAYFAAAACDRAAVEAGVGWRRPHGILRRILARTLPLCVVWWQWNGLISRWYTLGGSWPCDGCNPCWIDTWWLPTQLRRFSWWRYKRRWQRAGNYDDEPPF